MLDRSSIASYIGAMFLAEPHFHDDDAARVYFEKILDYALDTRTGVP